MKRQLRKELQKPLIVITMAMLVLGSSINNEGWDNIPFLAIYFGLLALNIYVLVKYTNFGKED